MRVEAHSAGTRRPPADDVDDDVNGDDEGDEERAKLACFNVDVSRSGVSFDATFGLLNVRGLALAPFHGLTRRSEYPGPTEGTNTSLFCLAKVLSEGQL